MAFPYVLIPEICKGDGAKLKDNYLNSPSSKKCYLNFHGPEFLLLLVKIVKVCAICSASYSAQQADAYSAGSYFLVFILLDIHCMYASSI